MQKCVFGDKRLLCAGGRVVRWQVRCSRAGVVYLAIWRGQISSSITLILSHRLTVPQGMEGKLVVSVAV